MNDFLKSLSDAKLHQKMEIEVTDTHVPQGAECLPIFIRFNYARRNLLELPRDF